MSGSSSMTARRPTRRTRIVCISDTHNSTVKLPSGDVLIHAGDLTNQGSYTELSKAVQWLEKTDFEAKIVIAGNHDITLDHDFYSKHGSSFHNQNPQDLAKCQSLFTSSRTITYLQNTSATVRLARPDGPRTELTVFGSPYSPQYGTWAFMYPRPGQEGGGQEGGADTPGLDDVTTAAAATTTTETGTPPSAADLWATIPSNTDILVTHTPPYGHCDDSCGCEELRKALARVRPRLHVCGHVHQGRGAERVRWDTGRLGDEEVAAEAEVAGVEAWTDPNPDPASAKISLVDLTARGGKRPLDFDDGSALLPLGSHGGDGDGGASDPPDPAQRVLHGPSSPSGPESQDKVELGGDPAGRVQDPDSSTEHRVRSTNPGQPATRGRAGRRETCVVNCAIVATGWPHTGGKRFNKPIVVDLDLPVWR